jgi:hypothetical protein
MPNHLNKPNRSEVAAVSLHFCHYNFVRRHQTLRVTPAMAAKITRNLMTLEDLVDLID